MTAASELTVQTIRVSQLEPNPWNRKQFDQQHALDEGRQLAALMETGGLDVAQIAAKVGRAAEAARWAKATPALLEAIAEKLKGAPTGTGSAIGKLVLEECRGGPTAAAKLTKYLAPGKTADDLVRFAAFKILSSSLGSHWVHEQAPRALKPFGIDARAIVNKAAPTQAAAKKATKTAGRRKNR